LSILKIKKVMYWGKSVKSNGKKTAFVKNKLQRKYNTTIPNNKPGSIEIIVLF
jgi:hypothetical protein